MAFHVLTELCKSAGAGVATIVLEGDQIEELSSLSAREAAVKQAGVLFGMGAPGVSNQSGPYPVDAEGKTDDDVILGKRPVAAYRQDYTIRSAR